MKIEFARHMGHARPLGHDRKVDTGVARELASTWLEMVELRRGELKEAIGA